MESTHLLPSIESIDACAIEPALWSSTVEEIATALDSPGGPFAVRDLVTGTERALVHVGIWEHDQAQGRRRLKGAHAPESLFAKTGTKRQTDLVRLRLAIPPFAAQRP